MKQKSYSITFNEDRDGMLNVMLRYCAVSKEVIATMKEEGLKDVFLDFLKELSIRSHQQSMCGDKNCKYNLYPDEEATKLKEIESRLK